MLVANVALHSAHGSILPIYQRDYNCSSHMVPVLKSNISFAIFLQMSRNKSGCMSSLCVTQSKKKIFVYIFPGRRSRKSLTTLIWQRDYALNLNDM